MFSKVTLSSYLFLHVISCSDIKGTECNPEKEDLNTRKSLAIYTYVPCKLIYNVNLVKYTSHFKPDSAKMTNCGIFF